MAIVLYQLLSACPAVFKDQPDSWDWTPLQILAQNKEKVVPPQRGNMIDMLIRFKADVECRRGPAQKTPLMLASSAGHVLAVERLMLGGADPEATDGNGTTAADVALRNNSDILNLLRGVGGRKGKGTVGRFANQSA